MADNVIGRIKPKKVKAIVRPDGTREIIEENVSPFEELKIPLQPGPTIFLPEEHGDVNNRNEKKK